MRTIDGWNSAVGIIVISLDAKSDPAITAYCNCIIFESVECKIERQSIMQTLIVQSKVHKLPGSAGIGADFNPVINRHFRKIKRVIG